MDVRPRTVRSGSIVFRSRTAPSRSVAPASATRYDRQDLFVDRVERPTLDSDAITILYREGGDAMKFKMFFTLMLISIGSARADGPADNVPETVRPIPKPGIELSADDKRPLERSLAELDAAIERLSTQKSPAIARGLIDVRIFQKAVRDALKYQEFFDRKEIAKASELLEVGLKRARELADGKTPWADQTGLVPRGYVSKIDDSVQPYGLVVPASFRPGGGPYRLDVWFHGRGETLSELNFTHERLHNKGQFTPADTFVLHPYGRYCNAFKFAGEIDVLEAIDAVKRDYRIDEDRIAVRGFSMGGAACWQFAVNYSDRWFCANPGAGFAETPRFLKIFQREKLAPTPIEQTLWRLYDCDLKAVNLKQCPTVAYSGEIDNQKQAADVMAEALAKEGITLTHIIGPKTRHSYHPDSAREVERRVASLAVKGRERFPRSVSFVTYTLKYNKMNWLTIDALGEHWKKARVDARIVGDSEIAINSENVAAITLDFPSGFSPFDPTHGVAIHIDEYSIGAPSPVSDRSWSVKLRRAGAGSPWTLVANDKDNPTALRKTHDLQGPIDDAFMDRFIFVTPTSKSPHAKFESWTESESRRAIGEWRRQFRGEPIVKRDSEIGDAEIASANLVLWGDPVSNAVLAKIVDRLPIAWKADSIEVGGEKYSTDNHALVLVYPNPLNPNRYVVLNSGFTFREYDYLSNARQVPRLPDWSVIDLSVSPSSRYPGKVVAADFFDEEWKFKSK
jgi:dienelactone hydrolase